MSEKEAMDAEYYALLKEVNAIVSSSGITQKALSEAIGIDAPKLCRILNGENKTNIGNISTIIKACGYRIKFEKSESVCPFFEEGKGACGLLTIRPDRLDELLNK